MHQPCSAGLKPRLVMMAGVRKRVRHVDAWHGCGAVIVMIVRDVSTGRGRRTVVVVSCGGVNLMA